MIKRETPTTAAASPQAGAQDCPPMTRTCHSEGSRMQPKAAPKEGLRQAIIAKRQARGDTDIKVDFREPEKTELTPQEKAKKERRKEQNRRAAQRCRMKKRQNQNKVLQTFQNILDSNKGLRDEMRVLKVERDNLQMAWSSHCHTCPLLSPSRYDMPSAVKMEAPNEPMCGIKQEIQPLEDCMVASSGQMMAALPSASNGSHAMNSFHSGCFPYNGPFNNTHSYPQLQPGQHVLHQQHQHAQNHPWPVSGSFKGNEGHFMGPLPENTNPLLASPVSPNSSATMPYLRPPYHPKMQVQPPGYDNSDQNNQIGIGQENVKFNVKNHMSASHQRKSSDAATCAILASTPSVVTARSTPKLGAKYPDLCHKLQRASTMSEMMPSISSPITRTLTSPAAGSKTIAASLNVSSFSSNLSNSQQKTPQTNHPDFLIQQKNTRSSPDRSSVKDQASPPISHRTPNNATASSCAMGSTTTSLPSCQHVVPCLNSTDSVFTEITQGGKEYPNMKPIPEGLVPIVRDVSLMDTADLDADIYRTALDLENSYNVTKSSTTFFNGHQGSAAAPGVSDSGYEDNYTDASCDFSMAENVESTLAVTVSTANGSSTRNNENDLNFLNEASLPDEFSDIASKELIFFQR